MKLEKILKSERHPYAEIARGTKLSRTYVWAMVNRKGFSAMAARELKKKYSDLDVADLLTTYPL